MENEVTSVEIRRLKAGDSELLYDLFRQADREYYTYFTAFEIDLVQISDILKAAKKDPYFGFFIQDALIGFFMLRGFDAGYEIPSYGVFISEKYAGKGLARLSVEYAIAYCKLNHIPRLMLKVHPLNIRALNLYLKMGFVQTGFDHKNNNLVFHKTIN